MNNVLEDSLFVSQTKKFDEIQSIVRQFSAEYVGNSIIKDNIPGGGCGSHCSRTGTDGDRMRTDSIGQLHPKEDDIFL